MSRKTDRPTVFLSFLKATAEETHALHEALQQSDLVNDYRFMLTAKPLQALSEKEALEILGDILKDNQAVHLQAQIDHFIKAYDRIITTFYAMNAQLYELNTNIQRVADSVNTHQHTTVDGKNVFPSTNAMPIPTASHLQEISHHLAGLNTLLSIMTGGK